MAAIDDVDRLIERYHLALAEFMRGNPEPAKELWSHRDDVTLANPQGSAARGWGRVAEAMERAASSRRDGRFVGSEAVAKHATPELAYVVEVERLEAKVHGGGDITPYALRDDDIAARRRRVECRASARGPDDHDSASGIGHAGTGTALANSG